MLYYIKREVNSSYSALEIDLKIVEKDSVLIRDLVLDPFDIKPIYLGPYKLSRGGRHDDFLDCISLSGTMIISERAKKIFSKLVLPRHDYIPVKFFNKSILFDSHYAFFIIQSIEFLNIIDWEKSTFYKTKDYHEVKLEEFKFSNWEEMLNVSKEFAGDKEFGFLYDLKIRYHEKFDLINFGYYGFPPGFICTEKTKCIIEAEALSGFAFEPVEDNYFV